MPKKPDKLFDYRKNQPWTENLSILMQIGLTMAGCIGFCFFIGLTLDRWLSTRGVFTAVFTVLGVIGGGVVVYREIMEIVEDKPEVDRRDGDSADAENERRGKDR